MPPRELEEEEVVGPRRPYANTFPRCASPLYGEAQRAGRDARDDVTDVADGVGVDAKVNR